MKVKLFRAYIIVAVVCISITVMAGCIFIADETARMVSMGEETAVVVLNSTDEKLYEDSVNPLPMLEKLKKAAEKAAAFAPPPVNNIYWCIQSRKNVESNVNM